MDVRGFVGGVVMSVGRFVGDVVLGVGRFFGGLVRTRTWHDLRDLGNSRLIRTSFIWLILVPAAAKMLQPFVGEYTLTIPELGIAGKTVGVYLPPGWLAFYFMSVCFALGQAIYYIRCPELVRQFANWGEYRDAHKGNDPLIHLLADQLEAYDHADHETLHRRITNLLGGNPSLQPFLDELKQRLPGRPQNMWLVANSYIGAATIRPDSEQTLSDVFAIILKDVQRTRQGSLRFCRWSFRAGFLLFLWTAAVNLEAVCRLVINQWGG